MCARSPWRPMLGMNLIRSLFVAVVAFKTDINGNAGLKSPEGKIRMKEIMPNNSTTSISQARKAVEQLKMEAYLDRIKVSKAAADLLAYCDAHMGEDPLIIPVPASENPFREKKLLCTIL
ncbi:GNG4: Guanine nucleotide-binding protein subunit gamma [Crotalus adamanteus]